ncbi:hypothetical protein HPB52_023363 [Rhipicephalus sanguineus]|uniref:Uncharacterized protein n=1 Tax=Rhipicephalus sanguineus TaxID=34632 RepID=A0A9D4QCR3_RHISA|nr:hypothetical protein HPB52_023363 [Rhipicephalus sanguineus]
MKSWTRRTVEERIAVVTLGLQVTVFFLPCRVRSEALAQALSHGIASNRHYKDAVCTHEDEDVACYVQLAEGGRSRGDLRLQGHAASMLTLQRGVYGHDGEGFSLPSLHCGDLHENVTCTIRQSYSEAASKNFPRLQAGTPSNSNPSHLSKLRRHIKRPLRPWPTRIRQCLQTLRSDLVPRVQWFPTKPQVEPLSHKAPFGERVADGDVTSEAHHIAARSLGIPPIIEKTPFQDDEVSIREDTNSTTSETPVRIDDEGTPSDVSQDSLDAFVPTSLKSPGTKRQRISTSDSEAPSRDRSSLPTLTRPRKPRGSASVARSWPGADETSVATENCCYRLSSCGSLTRSPTPATSVSSTPSSYLPATTSPPGLYQRPTFRTLAAPRETIA